MRIPSIRVIGKTMLETASVYNQISESGLAHINLKFVLGDLFSGRARRRNRRMLYDFQRMKLVASEDLETLKLRLESSKYILEHMKKAIDMDRMQLLDYAAAQARPGGLWLEFGVYRGDSINYLAERRNGHIHGFDSFEGLPEDWGTKLPKGTFRLIEGEIPMFRENVVIHKGWFNETLPGFLDSEKENFCSFIHIDSDLYSSATYVLGALKERIIPGTIIVFDEYFNYKDWKDHEYRAFQEFIASTGLEYEYIGYNKIGEQVAVKIKGSSVSAPVPATQY